MLEILVLLSLVKPIEAIAAKKGEKPYRWRLITVGAWFGAEITGALIARMITSNMLICYASAIPCAIASYFVVKHTLKQMPDKQDDLLSTLGQEI